MDLDKAIQTRGTREERVVQPRSSARLPGCLNLNCSSVISFDSDATARPAAFNSVINGETEDA
jgi:hypothetical protein